MNAFTSNVNRLLFVLARLVVGGTFLYAALSKLPDLRTFAEEVANYQLLPAALVPVAALAFVGVELVAGAALLVGAWVRAAALLCSAMLVLFVAALSQALLRGIDLRCGCFGGADVATWGTVARDVALLVPALLAAWWAKPNANANQMTSNAN